MSLREYLLENGIRAPQDFFAVDEVQSETLDSVLTVSDESGKSFFIRPDEPSNEESGFILEEFCYPGR